MKAIARKKRVVSTRQVHPVRDGASNGVHEYTAIFEPAEEGGYVVTVPALPGLHTEGDTFEEARVMAEDAIRGYLEHS